MIDCSMMIRNFKNIWIVNFHQNSRIFHSTATCTIDTWVCMIWYNSILYTVWSHMLYVVCYCKLIVKHQVKFIRIGRFSFKFHWKNMNSLNCMLIIRENKSDRNQWYYYSRHIYYSTIMIDYIHSYNSLTHDDNWIKLRNCQFFNTFSIFIENLFFIFLRFIFHLWNTARFIHVNA